MKRQKTLTQIGEKEPPEHLALNASGACVQELHRTGGNRDPILERHTQTFTCTGSQGKAVSIGIRVELDCNSWRISWENGGDCALLWGKGIGGEALGDIQQPAFLWRGPFLGKSGPSHQH